MTGRTYFEDVQLDEVMETPGLTVTEAHVAVYAGLAGDPPIDPTLVPELLPLCLSTGLGWRMARPPLLVLAFMGIDWHVLEPLRVGHTIHGRSRTVTKRSMREGGVIVEEHEILDHQDRVLQHGKFTFLVAKRPAAA